MASPVVAELREAGLIVASGAFATPITEIAGFFVSQIIVTIWMD